MPPASRAVSFVTDFASRAALGLYGFRVAVPPGYGSRLLSTVSSVPPAVLSVAAIPALAMPPSGSYNGLRFAVVPSAFWNVFVPVG